ncbi:MAG: UvrD-helicase domain-containing protein, partial [Pseudomonadota bacterium]
MTFDQNIASDPNISVWVSANAGTGKTKVLTDRVLRLLLSGCPPQKILCITYTKAAASEMEHRIEAQLGSWAIDDDEILKQKLEVLMGKTADAKTLKFARQLFANIIDAPQRVRIQTIHGFCQSILKKFPLEAGVPPHFTLIDNNISQILLEEAKKKLFEVDDARLKNAINNFAEKITESSFNNIIANIIEDKGKFSNWFSEKNGAESLITKLLEKTAANINESEEDLFFKHFSYSEHEIKSLKIVANLMSESDSKIENEKSKAIFDFLESGFSYKKYEEYSSVLITTKYTPRVTVLNKPLAKRSPDSLDFMRLEQERVFNFSEKLRTLRNTKLTCEIICLAEYLLGIYQGLKNQNCYLDYDDIIINTVNLLSHKSATAWVLYKLDGGIDHLLLDEAQDTSPLQWQLIDRLTEEFFSGYGTSSDKNRTLFVVGDGKQSIFSFQGAKPDEFNKMQSLLRKRIANSGLEFRNIRLNLSFRSTQPVLKAVDDVFAQEPANIGLMFDDGAINHAVYRKGMAGRVELWDVVEVAEPEYTPDWEAAADQVESRKAKIVLAQKIATEIKKWFDEKRKLPSSNKAIEAGDIMILV